MNLASAAGPKRRVSPVLPPSNASPVVAALLPIMAQ